MQSRLKAITLYRNILKLHRIKIPSEMRTLGDVYVRNEFQLFKNVSNEDQLNKFYIEWYKYVDILKNTKDNDINKLGKDLNDLEKKALNDEQVIKLQQFYSETTKAIT